MASSALYLGPPLSVLHESYAKNGSVDPHAPAQAWRSVLIDAPVPAVWRLLSDPEGWHRIDPGIGGVSVNGPVAPDTEFRWRNSGARIRSRFAVVEPEREISWTGASLGAKVVHRHELERVGPHRTRVTSEESMSAFLLSPLFNSRRLEQVLERWLWALKRAAEEAGAPGGQIETRGAEAAVSLGSGAMPSERELNGATPGASALVGEDE